VRLDASKAGRFSTTAQETGGFDSLFPARSAICHCPGHPKRRSWPHTHAAQLAKLGEQMEQPRVHFFIGIEANPALATIRQPGRQRHPQLASRRLLPLRSLI
jgi:hypothetical protein